jgi:hypothetical protein
MFPGTDRKRKNGLFVNFPFIKFRLTELMLPQGRATRRPWGRFSTLKFDGILAIGYDSRIGARWDSGSENVGPELETRGNLANRLETMAWRMF